MTLRKTAFVRAMATSLGGTESFTKGGLFVEARYNNDINTLDVANLSFLLKHVGFGDDWAQGIATQLLDRNGEEPPQLAFPIQPFPAIQTSPAIQPFHETLLQPKSTGNIPKITT